MESLSVFLQQHATNGFIPLSAQIEAVRRFNLSFASVEEETLRLSILPERYRRNSGTISVENQLRLFLSHVGLIGCGGLGGYILEELARIGIGHITVIDPDVFEEHNLNRQVLATMETLHTPKVAAAMDRVKIISPSMTVQAVQTAFSPKNGHDLLTGMSVVIDGLDSIQARLDLAEICESQGIPLIHGSIAGWYGQVFTQFPGDRTLQTLFGNNPPYQGIEQELGNPSFLPPFVASLEVAEAVKVLLGEGELLRLRFLSINLLDMEIAVIPIPDPCKGKA